MCGMKPKAISELAHKADLDAAVRALTFRITVIVGALHALLFVLLKPV